MESPGAPAVGGTDVQLDIARLGAPQWGPQVIGGNARLRRTVKPGVSVEAETGVLRVINSNGSGARGEAGDRNGYTGRIGVLLHSRDRSMALGAGLGGGLSAAAGNWGAADVHGVIGGTHRHVRPMLGSGLGYSAPFGDETFVVRESHGEQATLRLPRNLFAHVSLGLELGPRDRALVVGASMVRFWLRDDSVVSPTSDGDHESEVFFAIGAGLRLAFD